VTYLTFGNKFNKKIYIKNAWLRYIPFYNQFYTKIPETIKYLRHSRHPECNIG